MVEMGITRDNGKMVLTGKRCNPDIILWDRTTFLAKLRANIGIVNGRMSINVQLVRLPLQLRQPHLPHISLARTLQAVTIFSDDDYWKMVQVRDFQQRIQGPHLIR
jgi:hypothetical protein